jgi:hypothetical protein
LQIHKDAYKTYDKTRVVFNTPTSSTTFKTAEVSANATRHKLPVLAALPVAASTPKSTNVYGWSASNASVSPNTVNLL